MARGEHGAAGRCRPCWPRRRWRRRGRRPPPPGPPARGPSAPPALESAITRWGIPARPSSHAVSRAPWSSGRVSSTHTCASRPRSQAGAQHAARGAVAAGGERAGVAVGQRPVARVEQLRAQVGQRAGRPPAGRDGARARAPAGRSSAERALHRPGEVDRGGPRRAQELRGRLRSAGERHAVRGGQADRGRTAHGQRADRLRHCLRGLAAQPRLLGRQRAAGRARAGRRPPSEAVRSSRPTLHRRARELIRGSREGAGSTRGGRG